MTEQPPSEPQPEFGGQPQPAPDPYAGYPGPGAGDPNDPLVAGEYGGWWARGTALFRKTWKHLLILQIALVVLNLILVGPVQVYRAATLPAATVASRTDPMAALQLGSLLLSVVASVIAALVAAVVGLVALHIVVMAAANEPIDLAEAARRASRRLLPMIGWGVIFGLLGFVGTIFCILPGIYVALVSLLLTPVIAFERENPVSRCFALFNRNFGLALGITATMTGLVYAVSLLAGCIGGVFGAGSALAGNNGLLIVGVLVATLISAIFAAAIGLLNYPLQTVAYATLRARTVPLTTGQLVSELGQ
jgi:hypothetical protein